MVGINFMFIVDTPGINDKVEDSEILQRNFWEKSILCSSHKYWHMQRTNKQRNVQDSILSSDITKDLQWTFDKTSGFVFKLEEHDQKFKCVLESI